jgi:putative nucleotidyltransferase with HDIG domain
MNDDEALIAARVLDRSERLPSLPSLVLEILESFEDERLDITTLAGKIANDQALVARVMRVANSAFFGFSGRIGTIPEAVALLGFNNLRGLVTAAALINAAPRSLGRFDQASFWRHSLCTASCAKVLAGHSGLNPEIAFTAGVLHDIGKLVIALQYPEADVAVVSPGEESSSEQLEGERVLIGVDHAVLGGELAQRWKFPQPIREAIARHHAPLDLNGRGGLADVVFVANVFSHALTASGIDEQRRVRLAAEGEQRLQLRAELLPALAEKAHRLYAGSVLMVS